MFFLQTKLTEARSFASNLWAVFSGLLLLNQNVRNYAGTPALNTFSRFATFKTTMPVETYRLHKGCSNLVSSIELYALIHATSIGLFT